MIYPTIEKLTKGELNRYELVIGVAKCARKVTDTYVEMRQKATKMIENHETDKPLASLISPEYKDTKAVKLAITKLDNGDFLLMKDLEAKEAYIAKEKARVAREKEEAALMAEAEE